MTRATAPFPALVEVCLLTLWLGAALFFAIAVAPAAFAALPTSDLAGALVGRLLPKLFTSGAAVGLVVLAVEVARPREGRGPRIAAAVFLVAACALAQLVVAARIDRVRAAIDRPVSALAPTDARRVTFGRLHALSVASLGAAMLAAAVAAAGVARAHGRGGDHRGT